MPWIIGGVVLLVMLIVVVVVVAKRKKKPKNYAGADVYRSLLAGAGGATTGKLSAEGEKLKQNLRVKLLHQEEKVAEAIALERQRNPGGTEDELVRAAVDRWERENR